MNIYYVTKAYVMAVNMNKNNLHFALHWWIGVSDIYWVAAGMAMKLINHFC